MKKLLPSRDIHAGFNLLSMCLLNDNCCHHQSDFGNTVDEVESLVVRRALCWGRGSAWIEVLHLPVDSQHVSVSETQNDNSWHEPEQSQSLGQVGDKHGHLILQVEVFFVVDVIWSHFVHQVVESTSSAETLVSLRLISSQLFGGVPVEVPIVAIAWCSPCELIDHQIL